MVVGLGKLQSSESEPGSCLLQPGQTRAAWQNGASVVHLGAGAHARISPEGLSHH